MRGFHTYAKRKLSSPDERTADATEEEDGSEASDDVVGHATTPPPPFRRYRTKGVCQRTTKCHLVGGGKGNKFHGASKVAVGPHYLLLSWKCHL
ncbi:unnamed protein product [Caenorhabditis auriculariae]|uniref:Uncharacterized protein n=1 Tax=Caenorhabditis auriculariae TaxID=2777116 RepID=A0A8S1GYU8_9PELO|nr:unnamed protein product [Caenorhabditis auriculariae]